MSGHSIIAGVCVRCNQKPRPEITQEMRDAVYCTATGVALHLLDPCLKDISLYDMAHSLAGINRFCGGHWGTQHSYHYSIAEHSYWVSVLAPEPFKLWSLLHDGSEGLGFGDVISPLKKFLPDYKIHEKWMMGCVSKKWLGGTAEPTEVKAADMAALAVEQAAMQPPVAWMRERLRGKDTGLFKPECWSPMQAKTNFIQRFIELGGKE